MKKQILLQKILLSILLALVTLASNAQSEFQCDFVPTADYFKKEMYSNRNFTIPDDGLKFVININFHYIIGLNGENQFNLSEDKMLAAVAMMNVEFNSIGVFFKYRGTNFIKASNYIVAGNISATHAAVVSLFENQNLVLNNAINVYVGDGVGLSAGNGILWFNPIEFQYTIPHKHIILHETGHLLGLLHTFSDQGLNNYVEFTTNRPSCHMDTSNSPWLHVLKKPTFPILPIGVGVEAVTRDPSNPYYNADSDGDRVADTDAIFFNYIPNLCRTVINIGNGGGQSIDYHDWIEDPRVVDYTGDSNTSVFYCFNTFTKYSYTAGNTFYTTTTNGVDQTSNNLVYTTVPLGANTWQNIVATMLANCTTVDGGETYKCANDVVYNYMGRIDDTQKNKFTPGQKQRIRETLLGNFNFVGNTNDIQFAFALNEDGTPDIESLYEPFAIGATGGSTTGISTTAYSKTYSQAPNNTGANVWNCGPFVARFQTGFDCEFSNSSGQIVSQTPYQQYNTTLNGQLGLKIPILSQDIHYIAEPLCFTSFEPYIKGDVKSQNFLGSTYFTTEELDKIKASDPDLYNLLQSGQYHIISKETESGYQNQIVIFKN
jgi:hypothetical protein